MWVAHVIIQPGGRTNTSTWWVFNPKLIVVDPIYPQFSSQFQWRTKLMCHNLSTLMLDSLVKVQYKLIAQNYA